MNKIWKATEWETPTGKWRCNCVDDLGGWAGKWYIPARILDMSPAAYLEFVIKEFKPDNIDIDKDHCLVFFSWNNQSAMRLYKNFINKKARERNFCI